jgi:hypothetical protein
MGIFITEVEKVLSEKETLESTLAEEGNESLVSKIIAEVSSRCTTPASARRSLAMYRNSKYRDNKIKKLKAEATKAYLNSEQFRKDIINHLLEEANIMSSCPAKCMIPEDSYDESEGLYDYAFKKTFG